MTLNKPLFLQAAPGDPLLSYSAQELRTLLDALTVGSGVPAAADLAVTQRAAGANFSVDVAAGHAVIPGTSAADQGKYVVQSTGTENRTISGAPGAGFTRYDLVYAQVRDRQSDGGANYDWVIDVATGVSSGVLPATPANAIPLAQVGPVISSTPSITTSLITPLQTRFAPAGLILRSADVTAGQSTTAGFGDLTTVGPQVTVPLWSGQSVLVTVSAVASISGGAGHSAVMSFAVSGAGTLAASAVNGAETQLADGHTISRSTIYTAAATGPYTFTAKYQAVNGTSASFANRRLLVTSG